MSMYIKPYSRLRRRPVYRWDSAESDIHVPMDVVEEDGAYLISLIVPGLAPDEVEIEIVEKAIIIEGEFPAADEDLKYLRRERPTGKFRRVIRFAKPLNMDKSEASLEKGILSLRVPVAEAALPKTIKVKAK